MDILLSTDGDIKLADADIELTESVAQKIAIKLRWFANEWKFNRNFGVPYYEDIFVKQYDLEYIRQLLEEEILSVEEVSGIKAIELTVDHEKRALTVSCEVLLKSGETEKSEVIVNG